MWNEIIGLLQPEFEPESGEEQRFYEQVQDVNDWLYREHPNLNCQQITRAYNLLVNEYLHKSDGKVLNAYPKIDTRHVGEVLAAYRRFVDNTQEVQTIINRGMYLPEPETQSQDDIDAQMMSYYNQALDMVRNGLFYDDPGNGLAKWLHAKGRLSVTDQEWESVRQQAEKDVREDLAAQKQTASRLGDVNLSKIIGTRLDAVMQRNQDGAARVGERIATICLNNFLQRQCGGVFRKQTSALKSTPVVEPPPTAFGHSDYLRQLKQQLPAMQITMLQTLRKMSKERKMMDVYKLASLELNRREDAKKRNDDARAVPRSVEATDSAASGSGAAEQTDPT